MKENENKEINIIQIYKNLQKKIDIAKKSDSIYLIIFNILVESYSMNPDEFLTKAYAYNLAVEFRLFNGQEISESNYYSQKGLIDRLIIERGIDSIAVHITINEEIAHHFSNIEDLTINSNETNNKRII